MVTSHLLRLAGAWLFALFAAAPVMAASSGFIAADGRTDIAYDTARQVLYISGGARLRRYDMAAQAFLSPIALGGTTMGMDISADGRFLAVANGSRDAKANFVDIVTLKTGKVRRIAFPLASGEGGTYSVAYDADGKLLVTSKYEGSGSTPLRRYDLATGVTEKLATSLTEAMANPSANHRHIGIVEGNSSNGPYGRYVTGDASYKSTSHLDYWLFEIGMAPDGAQTAVPTYAGTFIIDIVADSRTAPRVVGQYPGQTPVGVAYAPSGDVVYFPFAKSNFVAEYDRRTMTELRRFTVPGTFDWGGNLGFQEGRVKVSSNGRFLFVTLDSGVFYQALTAN